MASTVPQRRARNTTSTEGGLGLEEMSTRTVSTDLEPVQSHADQAFPPVPRRGRRRRVAVVGTRQLIAEALGALLAASGIFAVTIFAPDLVDPAAIIAIGPDLVLIGAGDIQEHSLTLIDSLRHLAPGIHTVILADSIRADLVRFVLDQRTDALVLTSMAAQDLTATLSQVLRGQTALPAGWQNALTISPCDPIAGLSKRQLEVLRLLGAGCTYEEISERLVITVNTVKFHVRSIYLRLGVRNRLAASKLLDGGLPPSSIGPRWQSRGVS
jgi:DNA-binding NarL/FixJ family response regulator